MEDIAKLTERIEFKFLKIIIDQLRAKKMTDAQAKKYAQEFLPIEPFADLDDAKAKVWAYATKHPAFIELKEYVFQHHEEQKTAEVIQRMQHYINANDVDTALQVAKKG